MDSLVERGRIYKKRKIEGHYVSINLQGLLSSGACARI